MLAICNWMMLLKYPLSLSIIFVYKKQKQNKKHPYASLVSYLYYIPCETGMTVGVCTVPTRMTVGVCTAPCETGMTVGVCTAPCETGMTVGECLNL